jgi:hypothetical protein
MSSVTVSYTFRDEYKDIISQQCLYLNGKLSKSYGRGNDDDAYVTKIQATQTFYVGSSPFTDQQVAPPSHSPHTLHTSRICLSSFSSLRFLFVFHSSDHLPRPAIAVGFL